MASSIKQMIAGLVTLGISLGAVAGGGGEGSTVIIGGSKYHLSSDGTVDMSFEDHQGLLEGETPNTKGDAGFQSTEPAQPMPPAQATVMRPATTAAVEPNVRNNPQAYQADGHYHVRLMPGSLRENFLAVAEAFNLNPVWRVEGNDPDGNLITDYNVKFGVEIKDTTLEGVMTRFMGLYPISAEYNLGDNSVVVHHDQRR